MKGVIIGIIMIAGIAASMLFFFKKSDESRKDAVQNEQRKIPDIVLQNVAGEEVRLLDFTGTPLIVNSWATECPFCKEEILDFTTIQHEFGERIEIIAIDRKETPEKIKEFTDSIGVTDGMLFLLDPSDSFYRAIGGFLMPETIFVDENGFIKDHKRGPMRTEEIRRRVRRAFTSEVFTSEVGLH